MSLFLACSPDEDDTTSGGNNNNSGDNIVELPFTEDFSSNELNENYKIINYEKMTHIPDNEKTAGWKLSKKKTLLLANFKQGVDVYNKDSRIELIKTNLKDYKTVSFKFSYYVNASFYIGNLNDDGTPKNTHGPGGGTPFKPDGKQCGDPEKPQTEGGMDLRVVVKEDGGDWVPVWWEENDPHCKPSTKVKLLKEDSKINLLKVDVDLSAYVNKTVTIGFWVIGSDGAFAYVDDIHISGTK